MMRTIILPLDGSSLAERALPYAALLARRSHARTILVESVPVNTLLAADPVGAHREQVSRARSYLQTAAARFGVDATRVDTRVSVDEPVEAILDATRHDQADLIVMSTHGRGGLSRMLYGSVADQILRRTTVPVLLVPSIVEHAWPTDGPLSLLIPLDGSDLAAEALQSAELLTDAFGAKVTLLRVVQPPGYPLYGEGYAYIPYDEDDEIAEAHQNLDAEAVRLADLGLRVDTVVKVGDPSRMIGEVARERDVDAIVMATHGSGGLSRLILGSVATGTLRHTTAPLLLVRPTTTHASESPGGGAASDASMASQEAVREQNVTASGDPTLSVHLRASELELIEHSLQILGHAPGNNDVDVRAARDLAVRLRASAVAENCEPVSTP